ncbi:uncharacterized protein LOC121690097 isoform X2 [Alosa sapidissima]|uniref:uncharacterized protein LOC121690097 isoform X2 n=1 Tax=Alosa sapidissima TaxID=34773 RepID=UPI001C082D2E|nr:uncharacterized protein LOC121690097 isoform X2 [Alosa sapidissima]
MSVMLVSLLLCSITSTTLQSFEVVGPDGPVVGVVGEDLILPCSLKPTTSAVDMEVVWLIGGDIVHHYKHHKDWTDHKIPAYRGRTSLFREELHRGNLSLKLRALRLSDANTYRCYIADQTGTYEAPVELVVEAAGSTPLISTVSWGNGSVRLDCESTGWSAEPQVVWLTCEGRTLPAEPTMQRFPEGLKVKSAVTVREGEGSRFLCRVTSPRQTREMEVEVSRLLFACSRHHWALTAPILLFLSVCWILFYHYGGIHLYKQWVISKFSWAHDYSPLTGKDSKIYTDPLIIRRPRGTDRGTVSIKDYNNITLDQLFSPDPGQSPPSVVILQGHSGYSKSTTARKIICDWASRKRYAKEFKLVVLLTCKELNMEAQGEWRSLLELITLSSRWSFRHVIEGVLKDAPHKVLFIIDGFDELRLSAEQPSSHLPSQPFSRAPPADILYALLGGRILPESFLLVTTNHKASKKLSKLLNQREQRFTEIQGFSERMVKEYFHVFFENKERAKEAHQYVCENNFLFSSCSIPMRCWMICSILRESPEVKQMELENRTLIFLLFVLIVLKNTSMAKSEAPKMLAKLAKERTCKKEFLFEKESVSGLDKISLLQGSSARQYCFVHQTIQEFFSALYFITLESTKMEIEVKTLLDSVKGPSADTNIHLWPVIRFLFGFSNPNVWKKSVSLLASHNSSSSSGNTPSPTLLQDLLKEWILEEADKFILKAVSFFLHCLYELHDDAFVKKVMEKWRKVDFASVVLKKIDCSVLRYCLQCRPAIARLNLSNCNLTAEKLKLLAPALSQLTCEELWLDVEDLSDDDVDYLVSALGAGRILRRLRVENSQFSDQIIHNVLRALEQQKSVGSVSLSVKTVSFDTAEVLLNHLHKAYVTGIMSVTLTGMLQQDEHGNHLCSSLCVEKDQHSFTVSVEHDSSAPAVSHLSATLHTCEKMADWTLLLQSFQQLRGKKSEPELEEDVEKLLSSLRSLPGLKKGYLKSRVQISKWASKVFSLIHDCAILQEMDVTVKEQPEHGDTLCSFLSLRKHQHSTLKLDPLIRLTVGQHTVTMSSSQTSPDFSLKHRCWGRPHLTSSPLTQENRLSPLSLVSLTFPTTDVPLRDWVDFLKIFNKLSREVELMVGSLTENWAQRVLSFIREQPRDKEISVHVLKEWDSREKSLCSSLFVRKTTSNFRLVAEHLSSGSSCADVAAPALSYVSVLTDTDTADMDWVGYLKTFHEHEIESLYVYECVDPLLSSLCALSGLREVELRVSCLTEIWVWNILSLIQNCPSLQEVRLSAGRFVVSDGQSDWTDCGPLLLEEITHLQETPKRPNCTITLTGIKRRTVEVSSHFKEGRLQCNSPVRITIRGETSTEELLAHAGEGKN